MQRQQRALRHDPAQTVGRVQRHGAAPAVALADEQLHALARRVAQRGEPRPGQLGQREAVRRRLPEGDEAEPEAEPAVAVAPHQTVLLERAGEAVGGRPGQAGRGLQLGQPARPGALEGAQHGHGLVERPRRSIQCPLSRNAISECETKMPAPTTLPEKVWERHLVRSAPGEPDLLYIDLHLVHEVTSPQAFDGLRLSGRRVRRPELTVATADHNVPTADIDQPIADPISARQIETLRENAAEFGITLYPMGDPGQGIVHVIGPEQGRTQPGMTIVCGDSHTATHGAFGALAFGIGTSEVEHVLATQTLLQTRPKTLAVDVEGDLPAGVTAKDVILAVIGQIGTGGGIGHVIEYRGSTIRGLSMEDRMTVCNMSIEAGARAGLIAPDDTTFDYLDGRDHAPKGAAWEQALAEWRLLRSDDGAA